MNAGRTSGVGRARVATLTSCSASLPIHQLHRHQQWAFTGDSAYNLIVRQKMVADAQGGDTDKLLGLTAHSSIAQTPTISLHWRLCIQFNCATENGGRVLTLTSCSALLPIHQLHGHCRTPTISLHWRLCIQSNCTTENGGWFRLYCNVWPGCPFINCTDTNNQPCYNPPAATLTADSEYS